MVTAAYYKKTKHPQNNLPLRVPPSSRQQKMSVGQYLDSNCKVLHTTVAAACE